MSVTSPSDTTDITLTVCRGEVAKENVVVFTFSPPAARVTATNAASISHSEKLITVLKKKNQCANHSTAKPTKAPSASPQSSQTDQIIGRVRGSLVEPHIPIRCEVEIHGLVFGESKKKSIRSGPEDRPVRNGACDDGSRGAVVQPYLLREIKTEKISKQSHAKYQLGNEKSDYRYQ